MSLVHSVFPSEPCWWGDPAFFSITPAFTFFFSALDLLPGTTSRTTTDEPLAFSLSCCSLSYPVQTVRSSQRTGRCRCVQRSLQTHSTPGWVHSKWRAPSSGHCVLTAWEISIHGPQKSTSSFNQCRQIVVCLTHLLENNLFPLTFITELHFVSKDMTWDENIVQIASWISKAWCYSATQVGSRTWIYDVPL